MTAAPNEQPEQRETSVRPGTVRKQEWVPPMVQRMRAGDAEISSNVITDVGTTKS